MQSRALARPAEAGISPILPHTGLQPLKAATPLRLDGRSGGLVIERGTVDLFAIGLSRGRPSGARFPLCQLSAGELILALPAHRSHQIIAVGHRDTVVLSLS